MAPGAAVNFDPVLVAGRTGGVRLGRRVGLHQPRRGGGIVGLLAVGRAAHGVHAQVVGGRDAVAGARVGHLAVKDAGSGALHLQRANSLGHGPAEGGGAGAVERHVGADAGAGVVGHHDVGLAADDGELDPVDVAHGLKVVGLRRAVGADVAGGGAGVVGLVGVVEAAGVGADGERVAGEGALLGVTVGRPDVIEPAAGRPPVDARPGAELGQAAARVQEIELGVGVGLQVGGLDGVADAGDGAEFDASRRRPGATGYGPGGRGPGCW